MLDKEIAILEESVNEQKREELANDLAMAYMNKGVALGNLGRLNEAVAEYDKAIAIHEDLVNEQKRDELANDLAMAYTEQRRLDSEIEQSGCRFDKAIA